ncbi:RNA polymerase sigma factor [Kitasatospora sp. NPDC086801]|uniref:RNA polymerase sigma factor n=1 Tax=Kitasatospora sp. NPDC086801 TaxID=3364066 RepID=UPI003814EA57
MSGENDWTVRPQQRLTFDAFCETHEPVWRGLVRAHLHDRALVDQVTGAAKDALWHRWALALRESAPAAYAWRILKEQLAAPAHQGPWGGHPPRTVVPDWVAALHGAGVEVGVDLAAPEGRAALYRAVLRLSDRQYDVVVLEHHVGVDTATIAAYLDIAAANVRTTSNQAIGKLRRLLGAPGQETRE